MNIITTIITIMEKKKIKNLHLSSSAKINLFLDVLFKRPDTYHQIRTIFSEIELYDNINFTLTKNCDIKILSAKDFVNAKENLIYKVALFIKEKYEVTDGVNIVLEKNIPISAGLGGGSSNAAQTILALSDLWDLNLTEIEMHQIAKNFGSDINFFLKGGCVLGEGRGQIIKSIDYIEIDNILLVNPGFEIPSKEAYEAVNISKKENTDWEKLMHFKDTSYCYNKLEEGVCKKYPVIKQIIEYLQNNGANKVILSGSGATVIGFCPDRKTAEKLSKYYSKKGYWNYITKTKRRAR
ncbi:MAG: 4-(cytidine 5'-diphospho)-2-C-methyl-D-erythritol kinase [Candidatus Cloacimonetes bacterium]|nr:4-(cytidine 5'-diphospho)-2-C-methyl-D-erythritol kinase [Candidatus Cloacimonadota bacterium]